MKRIWVLFGFIYCKCKGCTQILMELLWTSSAPGQFRYACPVMSIIVQPTYAYQGLTCHSIFCHLRRDKGMKMWLGTLTGARRAQLHHICSHYCRSPMGPSLGIRNWGGHEGLTMFYNINTVSICMDLWFKAYVSRE